MPSPFPRLQVGPGLHELGFWDLISGSCAFTGKNFLRVAFSRLFMPVSRLFENLGTAVQGQDTKGSWYTLECAIPQLR